MGKEAEPQKNKGDRPKGRRGPRLRVQVPVPPPKVQLPACIPPKPVYWPRWHEVFDACGEERMINLIEKEGWALIKLAEWLGFSRRRLCEWIDEDVSRRRRFDRAMEASAEAHAAMALQVLADLPSNATPAEMVRARELAHGHRWEAKMRDRRRYGDQAELTVRQPIEEVPRENLASELEQIWSRGAAARALAPPTTTLPPGKRPH